MYQESKIKDLVALTDGKPVTTSRQVAKKFGKRHDNILQLFQTRILGKHSQEFTELNFQVSEYIDSTGRKVPELLMTKDGFKFKLVKQFFVMAALLAPGAHHRGEHLTAKAGAALRCVLQHLSSDCPPPEN